VHVAGGRQVAVLAAAQKPRGAAVAELEQAERAIAHGRRSSASGEGREGVIVFGLERAVAVVGEGVWRDAELDPSAREVLLAAAFGFLLADAFEPASAAGFEGPVGPPADSLADEVALASLILLALAAAHDRDERQKERAESRTERPGEARRAAHP
jgi:hypothetical protein